MIDFAGRCGVATAAWSEKRLVWRSVKDTAGHPVREWILERGQWSLIAWTPRIRYWTHAACALDCHHLPPLDMIGCSGELARSMGHCPTAPCLFRASYFPREVCAEGCHHSTVSQKIESLVGGLRNKMSRCRNAALLSPILHCFPLGFALGCRHSEGSSYRGPRRVHYRRACHRNC